MSQNDHYNLNNLPHDILHYILFRLSSRASESHKHRCICKNIMLCHDLNLKNIIIHSHDISFTLLSRSAIYNVSHSASCNEQSYDYVLSDRKNINQIEHLMKYFSFSQNTVIQKQTIYSINCQNSQITNFGLDRVFHKIQLRYLLYLNISQTNICDISDLHFCEQLRVLSAKNTHIHNITPLLFCENLYALDLKGSPVTNIPNFIYKRLILCRTTSRNVSYDVWRSTIKRNIRKLFNNPFDNSLNECPRISTNKELQLQNMQSVHQSHQKTQYMQSNVNSQKTYLPYAEQDLPFPEEDSQSKMTSSLMTLMLSDMCTKSLLFLTMRYKFDNLIDLSLANCIRPPFSEIIESVNPKTLKKLCLCNAFIPKSDCLECLKKNNIQLRHLFLDRINILSYPVMIKIDVRCLNDMNCIISARNAYISGSYHLWQKTSSTKLIISTIKEHNSMHEIIDEWIEEHDSLHNDPTYREHLFVFRLLNAIRRNQLQIRNNNSIIPSMANFFWNYRFNFNIMKI